MGKKTKNKREKTPERHRNDNHGKSQANAEPRCKPKKEQQNKKPASQKPKTMNEKKHPHAHLPLHEQIKQQLALKETQPKKKDEREAKHPEKVKKEHEEKAEKKEGTQERSGKQKFEKTAEATPFPAFEEKLDSHLQELDQFERSMIDRIEIEEHEDFIMLKISGSFNLNKKIRIRNDELPDFLQELLPRKIGSMAPGDELEIIGMDSNELMELFKKDIIVEPKGEIEVSEREDGGRISIDIKIVESSGPIFDYSKPRKTIEDVRRLVEREKLAMIVKKPEMPVAEASPPTGGVGDDWLREQIRAQTKDVVTLAKEMGEMVKPPLKPKREVIPILKSTEPEAVNEASHTVRQAEPKAEASLPKEIAEGKPAEPETKDKNTPEGKAEEVSGGMDMREFMDAYKEEAVTYVEVLKKLPQLKENAKNTELISEIHRSAHSLKSMSATMGFGNISKISKALEILFAAYKKTGEVNLAKYDAAKEAVDKINELYSDLANSEKANVDEIVKKVEDITPK